LNNHIINERMNRTRGFKKKELMILVLILSILLHSSENFSNLPNNIQALTYEMNLSSFSYIYINEDSDFVDYGFLGNGTTENPYLIQDMNFSELSPTAASIYIQNTTKHFRITNITITSDNSNGIILEDIASGTGKITETTIDFDYEFNRGIRILHSDGIVIKNNILRYCQPAIDIWWSEDIEISDNELEACLTGLACVGSDYIDFYDNILESTEGVRCVFGCTYVTISNNYMDVQRGVSFYETDYSEITSNIIEGVITEDSIYFSESSNNFIYNNTITITDIGIKLESNSNNNVFSKNTCTSSSQYNLFVESCEYFTCIYNNFSDSTYQSVLLHFVSKIVFMNNDIIGAHFQGVYIASCLDIFMSHNYIARTEGIGIFCDNVDDSNFVSNYIHENTGYGIQFDVQSSNNVIHHNEFYNNNLGGNSQAYDSGTNNTWFDSTLKEGNMWMDYEGEGDYYIDGTAQSVDIYPLGSEPTKTNKISFSTVIIIFSLCILTFHSIISRRKNRTND